MTTTTAGSAGPTTRRGSDRLAAVVLAAAAAALTGLTLWGQLQNRASAVSPGWDLVVAVAAVAIVPLLVTRPVPVALLLAALAVPSACGTPAATLAVFHVARCRPFPVACLVAAAGFLAHLLRWIWQPLTGLGFGWWLLLDLAAHAALLGWGALWQARQQAMMSLRDRVRRAEADRERQLELARAAERTRIAREMHDVLAHRLSLLATYAGALEFRPDAPAEQRARAAAVLRDGTHQALEELRDVIGLLRDSAVADGGAGGAVADGGARADRPQPGLEQITELVDESAAAGDTVALVADQADPRSLPGVVARTAYRVVQEGLTNARRHAPGAAVTVLIAGGPGTGLQVQVDNGRSTRPAPAAAGLGAGVGLIGLTERVELAGGRLTAGPAGDGFRLQVALPWPR